MVNDIKTVKIELDQLDLPEVYRYMGMRGETPKGALLNLVEETQKSFFDSLKDTKACFAKVPVSIEDDEVTLGELKVKTKSLSKHLRGCNEAYLFVATLGMTADRYRSKETLMSSAKGLVLDAMANTAIEQVCDKLCDEFERLEGKKLKSRFSPGYGDVPLEFQKELLPYLDTSRQIGVSLTDSLLMVPTKTVSAIVGIE